MTFIAEKTWLFALCVAVLAAWWLTVRQGASYRGASGPVSLMILVLAALMSFLAVTGQNGPRRANAAPHVAIGH